MDSGILHSVNILFAHSNANISNMELKCYLSNRRWNTQKTSRMKNYVRREPAVGTALYEEQKIFPLKVENYLEGSRFQDDKFYT